MAIAICLGRIWLQLFERTMLLSQLKKLGPVVCKYSVHYTVHVLYIYCILYCIYLDVHIVYIDIIYMFGTYIYIIYICMYVYIYIYLFIYLFVTSLLASCKATDRDPERFAASGATRCHGGALQWRSSLEPQTEDQH